MATILASACFEYTQGMYCNGQRFQYVIRYGRTGGAALNALQVWQDMQDRFINQLINPWQAAMSSEVEIVGWSVEAVIAGAIIPYRENFPLGSIVGSQAAPVYSQNVSMLGVGYSADQVLTGDKLRTAKTFYGPPPEGVCDTQVLQAGYENAFLDPMNDAYFGPFTGAITGTLYARCFGKLTPVTPLPTDVQYPINTWDARNTVFTQRRRLTPIL